MYDQHLIPENKKTNLSNTTIEIEENYPLKSQQTLCVNNAMANQNNMINSNSHAESDYSYYIETLLNTWFNTVIFEDDSFGMISDTTKEDSTSSCRSPEISETSERRSSNISTQSNGGITNEKINILDTQSVLIDLNGCSAIIDNNKEKKEKPSKSKILETLPKNQYCMINPYPNKTATSFSSPPSKMFKNKFILKDLDTELFQPSFFDMASRIDDTGLTNQSYITELIFEIWHTKDNLSSLNKKKHIYEPLEVIYSVQIENELPKRLLGNIIEYHKNDRCNLLGINLEEEIAFITKIFIRFKESPNKSTRIDEKDLRELYDKVIKLSNIKQFSENMKKNLSVTRLFIENHLKLFTKFTGYNTSINNYYQYNAGGYYSSGCYEINTQRNTTASSSNSLSQLNNSYSSNLSNGNSSNNSGNYSTGNAPYLEDIANNKISLDFITVNKLFEKLTKISPNEFNTANPFSEANVGLNSKPSLITSNLIPVVIFTYDEYTNAINLLMYLIIKYNVPRPFGMSKEESKKFENCVIKLTKLKIMSIIKFWVCERQEDFVLNDTLSELLMAFLDRVIYFEKDKHIKQVTKYLWEKWEKINEFKKKSNKLKKLSDSEINAREYKPAAQLNNNDSNYSTNLSINNNGNNNSNNNNNKTLPAATTTTILNGLKSSKYMQGTSLESSSIYNKHSQLLELYPLLYQAPVISAGPIFSNPIDDGIMLKNEIDVAEQLTLLEFKLFSKITINELLRLRYDKKDSLYTSQIDNSNSSNFKHIDNNNINNSNNINNNTSNESVSSSTSNFGSSYQYTNYKQFISRTNNTMVWIEYLVLKQVDINKKLEYIKKFLLIAQHCLLINNFSTCHTIVAALFRLKPYIKWKQDFENSLQELQQCFGFNEKVNYYTKLFHSLKSPCLPLLWIYSSLFQRYHESKIYKNIKGYSKKYILFTSINKMSELCTDFKKLQQYKYTFVKKEELYNFLKNCCHGKNQKNMEEDVKKLKEACIMTEKEKSKK